MTRRPTRPTMSLATLRRTKPEMWKGFQAILRRWIEQSPDIIREFAKDGVPGEAMLEQIEGLFDAGLLKIFWDRRGLWIGVWEPTKRRYVRVGGSFE